MSDVAGAPAPSAPAPSSTPSAPASTPSAAPTKTAAPTPGTPSGTSAPAKGAPVNTAPNSKHADPTSPTDTAAQTAAKAAAAERRKYKLKTDGVEEIEELTDDDITVRLQKAKAADKRMAEAAKLRKDWERATEFIKQDPFAALKEFGVDLDTLAEQRLAERYQEAILPPHEQERLKLQRELDAQKKQLQEFQTRQEAAQREAMDKQVFQQMEQEWKAVMQEVDFPADKYTMRLYAEIASGYLQQGIELSPKQIAGEIRRRMDTYNKGVLGQLKGESLLGYLGNDVVREVLRLSVERIKGQKAPDVNDEVLEATEPQGGNDDTDDFGRPKRKPNDPRAFRKLIRGF